MGDPSGEREGRKIRFSSTSTEVVDLRNGKKGGIHGVRNRVSQIGWKTQADMRKRWEGEGVAHKLELNRSVRGEKGDGHPRKTTKNHRGRKKEPDVGAQSLGKAKLTRKHWS